MSSNDQVPSISSAPESLAEDQARRTKVYLIQMGIRLVCFIGAVIVHGWFSFVLIGAAIVLPYVAVLFVNAGRVQQTYDVSPMEHFQVGAAPEPPRLGRVVELDEDGRVRPDDAAGTSPSDGPVGEGSAPSPDAPPARPARTGGPAQTDNATHRTTSQEPHDG
ncbi:DUF3099 domain-containing protein [Oerskovia turbata]